MQIGTVVGLAVYVVSSFLRAGHGLDLSLEAMGLVSERYLAFGRRYRGAVDGRDVEVTVTPGYGFRSPQGEQIQHWLDDLLALAAAGEQALGD